MDRLDQLLKIIKSKESEISRFYTKGESGLQKMFFGKEVPEVLKYYYLLNQIKDLKKVFMNS